MSSEGRLARRGLALAAVVAAAGLGAFAAPGLARDHAGGTKPQAVLRISDPVAVVGQRVVFDSSRSRGDIAYHLWDLNGDNQYETSTKSRARLSHVFSKAGTVRVAVAVFDDQGGYDVERATVRVVSRPSAGTPAASRFHGRRLHAATKADPKATGGATPRPKTGTSSGSSSPTLHAAATATSTVTIRDFEFDPKDITVSVGTTVTWTNQGPTAHTATADDGTFDTGNLVKGASGHYKFTKPGRYNYHCTPHPYMKGSVTVTGKSSNGSSSKNTSNGSNSGSNSSNKSSSLPHTGLRIAFFVLVGLILVGGGYGLRRQVRGY